MRQHCTPTHPIPQHLPILPILPILPRPQQPPTAAMDAEDFVRTAVATGRVGSVEVDQRSLVDKMLARYCTDGVVLRELLQNADDAEASQVEFHFKTVAAGLCPGQHWRGAIGPS